MASKLDPDADQAPARVSSLRPPPKPIRPRAILPIEDDGPTTRMSLAETVDAVQRASGAATSSSPPASPVTSSPRPAQVPPPPVLPALSGASAQTGATPLEPPKSQEAAGQRAPRERLVKIASIIFAAGVLVGVGGSALVMMNRTPPAVEVAAPRVPAAAASPASAAQNPAPPPLATGAAADDKPAAKVPAVEPPAEPADAAKAVKESPAVAETKEPARETSPLPVPSFDAPTCDHLTGFSRPKSPNKKTAERETRVGNRQLMLGNVANAQVA